MFFLVIAYFQPIFFSDEPKEEQINLNDMTQKKQESDHLATTGGALYIGKESLPNKSWAREADEVKVKKGKISLVELSEKEAPLTPFQLGQTLGEIGEKINFKTNISLRLKGKLYNLELSDGEMNYSPVVKFKNGAFAILNFSKQNGKLTSVIYLSVEELVQLKRYMIIEVEK
jgi:predicted mannosyl-3-phosphoglycerate phosphatase (HAD superfamily)